MSTMHYIGFDIHMFGLFASGLEEERVVYVDDVRLVGGS